MSKLDIKTVGPFILQETLGRGQTGVVKLGIHCQNKKKVAVKIIDRTKLSEQVLLKVEREIAIMKLIEHPHVLGLYDVYENKKHLFLILEHVSGGELFDYLVRRGRLPINEARRFFAQIVSAVDFCHKHCICHRDLKPENLLLDRRMNIKVADFGMASLQAGDNAMLETSCGSPHYACPEVIRGEKYDGRRADTWSCGVILYALLVGALPFDDDNLKGLLEKVKRGVFSIPSFVPSDLKELLRGMIEVDQDKRYTLQQVKRHPFLSSYKEDLPPDPDIIDIVKIENINAKDEIDPDVLVCMTSLGCFKNKDKLLNNLLKEGKTIEKVVYFLLLERKERVPCNEDTEVASINRFHNLDPPRKRVDSCGSPRLQRSSNRQNVELCPSPPIMRPRAETYTGGTSSPTPLHISPKHQSSLSSSKSPSSSPPDSPSSTTPPGSPWKSRLSNIKQVIVGSPKFHKKRHTHTTGSSSGETTPVCPSPDSSPDLVKKSWFGHLMLGHNGHHRQEEPFFILIKGKSFGTVKADVVHSFLSVNNLTHCVVTQSSFKAEYKKVGGKTMFRKPVRILVEITPVKSNSDENNEVHTVSITLESGPAHRFKKLCEKLQLILLSNKRQSVQADGISFNGDKACLLVQEEKKENSLSHKLELAHLSDTESESEILDSPRISKKKTSYDAKKLY
ncbi:serine/threonine-protein kinase BRSK2 isoform X2 [Exaiptasia diaphana]|uniref:non-specific serine/threonine protein kinase n=1 Tax=Exaiptasia diaphana TaxID=2652724 RepID=A0A913WVB4_EXADI|nr:serine/threonine-protein kinase BRSK2 isoform X2 [Exaiptasia diaphana]